jgi:hypothetical protein
LAPCSLGLQPPTGLAGACGQGDPANAEGTLGAHPRVYPKDEEAGGHRHGHLPHRDAGALLGGGSPLQMCVKADGIIEPHNGQQI